MLHTLRWPSYIIYVWGLTFLICPGCKRWPSDKVKENCETSLQCYAATIKYDYTWYNVCNTWLLGYYMFYTCYFVTTEPTEVATQGWRKQFYIGQANYGHYIFEHVGKGPPIVTESEYKAIVWNTINMQSRLIIRDSVACSPGKVGKTDALRLNLGAFQAI